MECTLDLSVVVVLVVVVVVVVVVVAVVVVVVVFVVVVLSSESLNQGRNWLTAILILVCCPACVLPILSWNFSLFEKT